MKTEKTILIKEGVLMEYAAAEGGALIYHRVCLHFGTRPYFVPEPDNWHLTKDAPEELKKEFAEYIKESADDENTVN